jgi:hypothetical protein
VTATPAEGRSQLFKLVLLADYLISKELALYFCITVDFYCQVIEKNLRI